MGYPVNPELGWYYVVNVAGEVEGVWYAVGDWIVWNGTTWDKLVAKSDIMPIGAQFNYFGVGIKGNIDTRDYEISVANGDDFNKKGWFVANGQAGTPACLDKIVRNEAVSGVVGGSDDALVISHVHQSKIKGSLAAAGTNVGTASPTGSLYDGVVTSTGVSGVNKNIPAKISAIPIIRMS